MSAYNSGNPIPKKPLFSILNRAKKESNPEKFVLQWMNESYELMKKSVGNLHNEMRENLKIYKTDTDNSDGGVIVTNEGNVVTSSKTRFRPLRFNHLFDIIEYHIARLTAVEPKINAIPLNVDSYETKIKAKCVKDLLNTKFEQTKFNQIAAKVLRNMFLFGEGYLLIEWDESAGELARKFEIKIEGEMEDESPSMEEEETSPLIGGEMKIEKAKARDVNEELEKAADKFFDLSEEDDLPEKDDDKIHSTVPESQYTGDIAIRRLQSWNVFKQPVEDSKDVDWIMVREFEDTERLKFRYKKHPKVGFIKSSSKEKEFIVETQEERLAFDKTCVFRIFHRATPELPNGRYIVATPEVILEDRDLPYEFLNKKRMLPIVSISDVEIDGCAYGIPQSVMGNGKVTQATLNNIYSIQAYNMAVFKPFMKVEDKSVDMEALQSGQALISYRKGAMAPEVEIPDTLSPHAMAMADKLEQQLQQLTGVFGTSRGAPPANTRSAEQLQFYDSKEALRSNPLLQKYTLFVEKVAKVMLAILAEYGEVQVFKVNRNAGEYKMRQVRAEDLQQDYDIKLVRIEGMPETPQAKLEYINYLNQQFPGMVPQEQVADMIGLNQSTDKYINLLTLSVDSAESENEDLLEGTPVEEPTEFEDHIVHMRIHLQVLQNRSFKKMPPEVQENFKDHFLATEMLIWEKMKKSPGFAQKIEGAYPQFPYLYDPTAEEFLMLGQEGMLPQEQAPAVPPPQLPGGMPGGDFLAQGRQDLL